MNKQDKEIENIKRAIVIIVWHLERIGRGEIIEQYDILNEINEILTNN